MVSVTIAFALHKGGTGKTTSCIIISGYLALWGKKVLVIDVDPQANATSALGVDKKSIVGSMYEVMIGEVKLEDAILETEIENIHLAPATLDLIGACTVPYEADVYEAQLKGVPLSYYKPKCKAGITYKKIAEEVLRAKQTERG